MNDPQVVTSHKRRLSLHLTACVAVALGVVAVVSCKSDPAPTAQDLFAAGTARAEATIRDVVSDPDRRDAALQIVQSYATDERDFLDGAIEIRDRIVELNRNYDATREQYLEELRGLEEHRLAFSNRMVSSWMSLTDLLEDDEEEALIALQVEEEERWRNKIK